MDKPDTPVIDLGSIWSAIKAGYEAAEDLLFAAVSIDLSDLRLEEEDGE